MFAHRSIGRSSLRSTPPLQPQCTRLQGYTENGLDFIGTWEEGKKRYIQYNGHNNDIEKKRFSSFLLFWTARNCRIFFSKRAFAIDFAVAATNTAFYILPCCRFIPRSKEEESGTRATQAQKRSCIPFFPPCFKFVLWIRVSVSKKRPSVFTNKQQEKVKGSAQLLGEK